MSASQQIIAAVDEVKIFIWVAIAIIWGIAHVASWIKKAATPAKQRPGPAQRSPIKQAMPMRMAPMPQARPQPPSIQRPRPAPMPAKLVPAAKPAKQPGVARSPRVMPPPLPGARLQPAPPPAPAARVVQSRPAPPPPPPAPVAPATRSAGINRWLRPATLRRQFILTEIFQKPLALRSEE